MVILRVGNKYVDQGLFFLTAHLNLLDQELSKINEKMKMSADPDTDGLLDRGEYFIGSGLVAIQRYLTSASSGKRLSQKEALSMPPIVNSTLTLAEALNAGANYWKHSEEWFDTLNAAENKKLKGNALATLGTLEKATPWANYTCANLLAVLVNGKEFELSSLLTGITEWRNNMMGKR